MACEKEKICYPYKQKRKNHLTKGQNCNSYIIVCLNSLNFLHPLGIVSNAKLIINCTGWRLFYINLCK